MAAFLQRVRVYWQQNAFCVAVEYARREYSVDDALTYADILWLLTRKRAVFPEPAAVLRMMERNGQ